MEAINALGRFNVTTSMVNVEVAPTIAAVSVPATASDRKLAMAPE